MTRVPLPHIGSSSGSPGRQPAARSMPAARVGRRGARGEGEAVAAAVQRVAGAVDADGAAVALEADDDAGGGEVVGGVVVVVVGGGEHGRRSRGARAGL
jgi:uncharacterized Zn-binding protein involved in type VI secretion